jgi:hypothetical protein
MYWINVKPVLIDGRFRAAIEMSSYDIPNILRFTITARRSDGMYEKRSLVYPSDEGFYVDSEIQVDLFGLNRRDYGQIVSVKVNDKSVYVEYGELPGLGEYRFRYDDGIITYKPDTYGNVVLDFQVIPTYDPQVILVADQSQWSAMYHREALIEVVLPGHDMPKTLYWAKEKVNTFNSFVLGTSCVEDCKPVFTDLPDGVYSFTLKASDGSEKQRSYLKTDLIRLKIDRLYMDHALGCGEMDKAKMDNIRRAEFYLAAAAAHMRTGNILKSNDLYCMANKMAEC